MALLTNRAVEDRVVRRVTNKAATYGQDISEELPESMVGRCILTLSNPH